MENATILLVENEESSRQFLAAGLTPKVRACLCASDGQDAWEKLLSSEGRQVNLVVCSLASPSGYELLQRVRASGNDIPFVFLTTNEAKARAIAEMRLGRCEFVQKPDAGRRLAEVIQKVLSSQKNSSLRRAG